MSWTDWFVVAALAGVMTGASFVITPAQQPAPRDLPYSRWSVSSVDQQYAIVEYANGTRATFFKPSKIDGMDYFARSVDTELPAVYLTVGAHRLRLDMESEKKAREFVDFVLEHSK